MTPLIHDQFLLESPVAQRLYHEHAAGQPIIDYHCHLSPAEVAQDKRWRSITEIWLGGDHYKWRALRALGVPENLITGDADDWDKFFAFATAMPKLLRNPLYHWSHLELARYFGVSDVLLSADTAQQVYERCNAAITAPNFSARQILANWKVEMVGTTDDPVDSLEHHRTIAADPSVKTKVLPTWRPDKALWIDDPTVFVPWLADLERAADQEVATLDDLLSALRKRHDFFASLGCQLSDRGIARIYADEFTSADAAATFKRGREGQPVDPAAANRYRSLLLHELAVMDAEMGWTMQMHIGAQRNNNSRMFAALGRDTGYDSMGDLPLAADLAKHFDRLDQQERLPKTIVYNLNPRDNAMIATLLGNFHQAGVAGKMQFGSGWWFLDQLDGMEAQLETLSQMGVLSQFVGMLTDSRSFLSYTRHEYFRRLLCNILGDDMNRGRLPNDFGLIANLVEDVCYRNAKRYFGF